MRVLLIIMVTCFIWGCKQAPKEETPKSEKKDPYFFWAVDWHPNKELFVVGGMKDTLRFFSSNDFQLIKNHPFKGTVTKTKWHPTKNILAISVQDRKSVPTLLNLDHNQSIPLDSVTNGEARAIGWNHSGDLLAVGDYEGTITLYNDKGTFLKKINTTQKSIIGLDWHPTENLIVAVGEKITLYDHASGQLQQIEDRNEDILMLCVEWHPSGTFFVTGDYGDFQYHYPPLLQYWSYTGQRIKSIEKSKAEYRNIKWSTDGDLLATASEKLRLWNQNGELIGEEATTSLLWGVDWNEDASKLIATDEAGNILLWNRTLEKIKEIQD